MAKPLLIGIIVVTILIAGTGIWFRFFKEAPKIEALYDFGDAPDGEIAYRIGDITVAGKFPSLAAHNGARTKETATVWLGEKIDQEEESKQVNRDNETDDGLAVDFQSCALSQATFAVHLSRPRTTQGTAYLNLFVDWNQDGQWQKEDECSPEWVVVNLPLDLSEQGESLAAYTTQFTGGKKVLGPWYRAVVTLNEPLAFESGEGEFQVGEVEDYGFYELVGGEREDTAVCEPDPLKVIHGESGTLKINEGLFSSRKISAVELDPKTQLQTKERNLAKKAGEERTFIYTSNDKQKDGPPRIETEDLTFYVKFGALGKKHPLTCAVWIVHDEKIINPPPPPPWEPPAEEEEVEKWEEPELPTQVRTLFCGDGHADAPYEECDPGNPEKNIPPVLCKEGECCPETCQCVP